MEVIELMAGEHRIARPSELGLIHAIQYNADDPSLEPSLGSDVPVPLPVCVLALQMSVVKKPLLVLCNGIM
jgi:hypothetical protein